MGIIIKPGSVTDIRRWSERNPVVAVDVVFGSSTTRKRGLVISGRDDQEPRRNFGELLSRLEEIILAARRTALVLEAPLSYGFDKSGCPALRGKFEDCRKSADSQGNHKQNGKGQPVYSHYGWYHRGAQSARAGAFFILRHLAACTTRATTTKTARPEVTLFEGFVVGGDGGNKPPTGKSASDDADAKALLDLFQLIQKRDKATSEIVQPQAAKLVSILDLIGTAPGTRAPCILVPNASTLIRAVDMAKQIRVHGKK